MSKGPSPPRQSRESSDTFSPKPRARISIVDHTQPADDSTSSRPQTPANEADSINSEFRIKASRTRSGTLRDQKAKWKYGKYSEERALDRPLSRKQTEVDSLQTTTTPDLTHVESRWGQNALERGTKKVQDRVLRRKRTGTLIERDTEVDVLYENQRGAFFCGIPFFSPKALNPVDPAPWVDGSLQRSRENITNAQVPDPSWEWVWRTWYVDMSRDVDEEGWEYSFFFKGFSWHGTHPWFHSFVRRRRWIRKRIRKHQDRDMSDPHNLTKDYFTIHSGRVKSISSRPDSPKSENQGTKKWGSDEKATWEEDDIVDMGTLLQGLKVAPVDSERITLIKNFIDHGGDDLYFLADEMPNIMAYFFHEHSCRRLLTLLTEKISSADEHLQEHEQSGKPQEDDEKRRTEALMKAAKAVDTQCKSLQFWSDAQKLPKINRVSFDLCGQEDRSDNDDKGQTSAAQYANEHPSNDLDTVLYDDSNESSTPTAKTDKGKSVLVVDYNNVGGFDGTSDSALSPTKHAVRSNKSSGTSKDRLDPRTPERYGTRQRASHSSLRRNSSHASSLKLAELSPEPVDDQPDEAEAPTHVKSKASKQIRPKSSSSHQV